jgi:hypothetical protein|tara:strand:- start:492 stop:788 length:297 start_codon:yes stop_codon:yes gene_type:complete
MLHDERIMGGGENGHSGVSYTSEKRKNLGTGGRIELAGGFVSDQKWRIIRQGSSNRHSLLFPTRKLIRAMVRSVRESYLLQEFTRSVLSITHTSAGNS